MSKTYHDYCYNKLCSKCKFEYAYPNCEEEWQEEHDLQIIADERERIVNELENRIAEETLERNVSDVGIGLEIALKIVRGGENE